MPAVHRIERLPLDGRRHQLRSAPIEDCWAQASPTTAGPSDGLGFRHDVGHSGRAGTRTWHHLYPRNCSREQCGGPWEYVRLGVQGGMCELTEFPHERMVVAADPGHSQVDVANCLNGPG